MLHPLLVIPFPTIDPVIFSIGKLSVRWYGMAYVTGFILAYLALGRMIRRQILRITPRQLGDLVTWLILGVLAGGRLGWWLVYHRPAGRPEPWYEPFALWHGGMSFHGALVGVMLVLIIFTRVHKLPLWNVTDCMALVVPIGLFFGRIANFINAELVGRPTNVPWGVIFPDDSFARHPSQIYEALLEGPLLLVSLWAIHRLLRPRDGQIAAMFLVLYGIFRFAVEFTREPDEQIGYVAFGWLTMGQLLSLLLVFAGIVISIYRITRPAPATEPPKPDKAKP